MPKRVRRAVIAGVGENYYGRGTARDATRSPPACGRATRREVTDAVARQFRAVRRAGPERSRGAGAVHDAARGIRSRRHELRTLDVPMLIVVGEKDKITGPPGALAEALPKARVVIVPKRDHMSTRRRQGSTRRR